MNNLKALSKTDDEYRVGNYIVLFGGRDLDGEYFTKNTDLESSYTKSGMLHVDFEHGHDPDKMGMDQNEILGRVDWSTMKADDTGVFVERVLSRRAKYMEVLEPLIEDGLVGTSSQAVSGKVQKTDDGEIQVWPLMRDSLTFTPAEPRMLSSNAIHRAKALYAFFPDSKSLAVVNEINRKEQIEACKTRADFEELLRNAGGFSRTEAKLLVAGVKSLAQSNSERQNPSSVTLADLAKAFKLNLGD